MAAIGCVRQIDKLGRLVLPADIRKSLNITDGVDYVEFYIENDSVILKKYNPSCIFCNSDKDVITYKDKLVCSSCLSDLKNA